MKIIKNNDTVKDTCRHCKSILEIEESDVLYVPDSHHGSFSYTCAVCGTSNNFDKHIPKAWAQNKYAEEDEF